MSTSKCPKSTSLTNKTASKYATSKSPHKQISPHQNCDDEVKYQGIVTDREVKRLHAVAMHGAACLLMKIFCCVHQFQLMRDFEKTVNIQKTYTRGGLIVLWEGAWFVIK